MMKTCGITQQVLLEESGTRQRRKRRNMLSSSLLLLATTTTLLFCCGGYNVDECCYTSAFTAFSTSQRFPTRATWQWQQQDQNLLVVQQHDWQQQQHELTTKRKIGCIAVTSSNRQEDVEADDDNKQTTTIVNNNNHNDDAKKNKKKNSIIRQFLGKGKDAIVREGCIIVSPSWEYHHLLMTSVLYVYGVGNNELNELVARCVIIDHPTAFNVGEMMTLPRKEQNDEGDDEPNELNHNIIFRGGDMGNDFVMMLHSYDGIYPNKKDSIGNSNIYEGGLEHIVKAIQEKKLSNPKQNVKLFFNFLEFSKQQLDDMFDTTTKDDDDGWMSFEVDPTFVLNNNYANKGDAWKLLRNTWKQQQQQHQQQPEQEQEQQKP